MTQRTVVPATETLATDTHPTAFTASVNTQMIFHAPPLEVWQGLMFYEEIGKTPPFYLRMLLPVPLGTEGHIVDVGDEAKCLYQNGHLLKRLTRIEKGNLYEFEVAEQALSVGGGIRLSGGRYVLRPLEGGRTEVMVETRYTSSKRPRWFWKPLEAMVCHAFHRYLLGSMRNKIESQ